MSDSLVLRSLERMEAWLDDPSWEPEAALLDAWQSDFDAAVAGAERSEGWMSLVHRAHEAGRRLESRMQEVAAEAERLRRRLESQDRGVRALKGYGAAIQ